MDKIYVPMRISNSGEFWLKFQFEQLFYKLYIIFRYFEYESGAAKGRGFLQPIKIFQAYRVFLK